MRKRLGSQVAVILVPKRSSPQCQICRNRIRAGGAALPELDSTDRHSINGNDTP